MKKQWRNNEKKNKMHRNKNKDKKVMKAKEDIREGLAY